MASDTPRRLKRADTARRVAEAWRLRTEGALSWDEIASRVGYANGPNALRAVRHWRQSLPALDVERMRDEAIARAMWLVRMAATDVTEDRPGCVTAMVRAEGRLAALCGLDQPRREQVIVGGESFWGELYRVAGRPRFRGELAAVVDVVEVEADDDEDDD